MSSKLPQHILDLLKRVEDTSVERMVKLDEHVRAVVERANELIAPQEHEQH